MHFFIRLYVVERICFHSITAHSVVWLFLSDHLTTDQVMHVHRHVQRDSQLSAFVIYILNDRQIKVCVPLSLSLYFSFFADAMPANCKMSSIKWCVLFSIMLKDIIFEKKSQNGRIKYVMVVSMFVCFGMTLAISTLQCMICQTFTEYQSLIRTVVLSLELGNR